MINSPKRKILVFMLIFSVLVLCSPHLILSKEESRGNLIGFIYGSDGKTPLAKSIVKIINISTGAVYESTESDEFGVFKIEGIERGLYSVSITTGEVKSIVYNLIGIKDRTAKVAFALNAKESREKETEPVGMATVIASTDPVSYCSVMSITDKQGQNIQAKSDNVQGEGEIEINCSPIKPHPPGRPPWVPGPPPWVPGPPPGTPANNPDKK